MAKPYSKKKIQETIGSNFGNYAEYTGGGASPNPSKPGTHGHGPNSDHRQQNNDTMQARTKDGKFTYKSVNGEKINPEYGPSRGETVNPLLTGGKNGVKIEDVETDFANQSGSYWNKYKDQWYTKGGEIVTTDLKTRVAGETIWNVAKRMYDKVKGEFMGESSTFDYAKRGRVGKEEQLAKQQVQATGQEQAVINPTTGGIKLKPGATPIAKPLPKAPTVAPRPTPTIAPQPTPTPVIPTTPGQAPAPTASLKHTLEQLKQARQVLEDNGQDTSGYTDEQLDQVVDDYIDFGEEEAEDTSTPTSTPTPTSAPIQTPNKEEDSESIKKIKGMGFSGE